MVKGLNMNFLLFVTINLFSVFFENESNPSVQACIHYLNQKIALVENKQLKSAKDANMLLLIKEEVKSLNQLPLSTFLLKVSSLSDKVSSIQSEPEFTSDIKKSNNDLMDQIMNQLSFIPNENNRVALFPFSLSGNSQLQEYRIRSFNNSLIGVLKKNRIMVLTGEDLLEECKLNAVDLQSIRTDNLQAVARFLKKTNIQAGVFGFLESESICTCIVYPDERFKIMDFKKSIQDLVPQIPTPWNPIDVDEETNNLITHSERMFKKVPFPNYDYEVSKIRNKLKLKFQVFINNEWQTLPLIEDTTKNYSYGMYYLEIPENLPAIKAPLRIVLTNDGVEPMYTKKNSRFGRIIGASVTIDGINLFLKDGKGEPSERGTGLKMLISPPGHVIRDEGAIRSGTMDESQLVLEGFYDEKMQTQRNFFISQPGDSFPAQFLGTSLKPLGIITIDLFSQKLPGDRDTLGRVEARNVPNVGIGAFEPIKSDIKKYKFDFYEKASCSYTISYKLKKDIDQIVPPSRQIKVSK